MMARANRRAPEKTQAAGTVDPAEVARFERTAATWWDTHGPARPLHAMNPVRLAFIRDEAVRHFGGEGLLVLDGLDVLDVGCGGGLLAEPLARLGGRVTGIDAGREAIAVARTHAEAGGLSIDYRATTAEALAETGAETGAAFDLVTALEVIEHVADPALFVETLARLTRPGGLVVLSTLNRTRRSYLGAIIGAEYVLRWVARGTHDWRRFLHPGELAGLLRAAGFRPAGSTGMTLSPLTGRWRLDPHDLSINYAMAAVRVGPVTKGG